MMPIISMIIAMMFLLNITDDTTFLNSYLFVIPLLNLPQGA